MERELDLYVRMTPEGRRVNYVPEELYLAEKARADGVHAIGWLRALLR